MQTATDTFVDDFLADYGIEITSDNVRYQRFIPDSRMAWAVKAWEDTSPVQLYTGSAGGGKSRLAAEKVNDFMLTYSGAMGLMLRKTRESMTNSTVLFFARTVANRYPDLITHKPSAHRFEYANGSILAYGGMKDDEQREQIRSIGQDGGLDIVWGEEANKLKLEDRQELITRMRGKAAPYTLEIYTTNPDAPMHWINQQLIIGQMASVYYSSAKDNPFNPAEYIDKLNKLTGVQRLRLAEGKWVQAEGVIYDNFEPEINVSPDLAYNPNMPLLWGVDDGYAQGAGPGTESYHPRVILIAQEDGRGGMNILAERYATGEANYDHTIDATLEMGFVSPDVAYVDSSAAMLRGALSVRGIPNSGATHPVIEGIRNLRRMISDGSGVALLHIHARCERLISELQMYRYDDSGQLPAGDRKPLKVDDHGPDTLRYLTYHLRFGE